MNVKDHLRPGVVFIYDWSDGTGSCRYRVKFISGDLVHGEWMDNSTDGYCWPGKEQNYTVGGFGFADWRLSEVEEVIELLKQYD
jgi:hypothetical protein